MSEFRVTARPYDDEATFENLGYPHKHTCNGCPRCDIFCYRIMADYAAGDYKLASARLDSVTKQLFPHRFEDMTTYDRPVHEQVAANQFRSNVPPSVQISQESPMFKGNQSNIERLAEAILSRTPEQRLHDALTAGRSAISPAPAPTRPKGTVPSPAAITFPRKER